MIPTQMRINLIMILQCKLIYIIMNTVCPIKAKFTKISTKTCLFTTINLYRISNRDSHCKIEAKSKGKIQRKAVASQNRYNTVFGFGAFGCKQS